MRGAGFWRPRRAPGSIVPQIRGELGRAEQKGQSMTEMVHGSAALGRVDPVLPRWWHTVDRWSIGAVLALFAIGLLLGLAASVPLAQDKAASDYFFVMRQAQFGAVGLAAMLVLSMLPLQLVRRLAVLGFAASLLAVMLLPIFGTDHGKGAVRWLQLPGANVQPSEFLKPAFVVVAAWLISAADRPHGPAGRTISFGLLALVVFLLVNQPDYGQAALLTFAWMVMWFVSGAPLAPILALVAALGALGAVAYASSEHVARRIDGFLSAEIDPTSQIGYATDAIREGGFLGVGIGGGEVKWRLPDAHTDFVIAVAAEEFGLLLVILVVGLYLAVVLRALLRLLREGDAFARLAGTGLACAFGVQALINLGVAARLLPAKGMTLPLISIGGSSLVATCAGLGMLLAFTRTRAQGGIAELMDR